MKVVDMASEKKRLEKQKYSRMVLRAYDNQEHDEKRKILDRREQVNFAAKDRL